MYIFKNILITKNNFSLKIKEYAIKKGTLNVFVGPNGCGKSTLLNTLALIDSCADGEMIFNKDEVIFKDKIQLLNQRRNISYLLQDPYLFNTSVYNNIAYGLKIRKIANHIIKEKIQEILGQFFISHLKNRHISQLSGGEAQLVALARSLVIDANVYLLDEPTSNVDKKNIQLVEDLIRSKIKNSNATIILTTHLREQAYRLSDNIFSIYNGKLKNIPYENVFSGPIANDKNDLKFLSLTENVKINLNYDGKGNITIAIDPNAIIISKEKMISSALNNFSGVINKIESYNGSLQIFIDVGRTFCVLITKKSFHDLGLNIGSKVWITFKVHSVKVIDEGEVQ